MHKSKNFSRVSILMAQVLFVISYALVALIYFSFSTIAVATTPPEDSSPENVIAVIPKDFPPTYFQDQKYGQPMGLAIDVMNELARMTGLKIKYQFAEPWDGIEQAVLNGKADLIPFRVINESTKQHFIFTHTLDATAINFIRRKSDPDILGPSDSEKIGVINKSTAHQRLLERGDFTIIPYDSMGHLLMDLITGQVDLILAPKDNLLELARTTGLEEKLRVVEPPDFEVVRAIALRPDSESLRQRLDTAIKAFDGSSAQHRIYERWLGKAPSWWTVKRVTFVLGTSFILLMVLLVFWRVQTIRRLNRELNAEKTFLQTMIDTIPDLVFYKNSESVYLGCNTIFAKDFIGLSREQIVGHTEVAPLV